MHVLSRRRLRKRKASGPRKTEALRPGL